MKRPKRRRSSRTLRDRKRNACTKERVDGRCLCQACNPDRNRKRRGGP